MCRPTTGKRPSGAKAQLSEVLRQLEETHRRLLNYLHSVPEEHFTRETRFRHRLRLDSYSHYPMHARAIREWRERPAD